jgi:hypothetical protein
MRTLFLLTLLCSQSLGEIGRREAERRRGLETQGATARKIEQQDVPRLAAEGNLGTFSPPPASPPARSSGARSGARASPERYRSAIQKLDRDIRNVEDRVASLRARAAAERWAPPRSSRGSSTAHPDSSAKRFELQIAEWETKLKRLKQDRFEKYQEGRKAGFLPGELDGKGMWP